MAFAGQSDQHDLDHPLGVTGAAVMRTILLALLLCVLGGCQVTQIKRPAASYCKDHPLTMECVKGVDEGYAGRRDHI
jgi:hypothetical protein